MRRPTRRRGEARGRAETLLQQLTIKLGNVPRPVRDAVDNATPEQLQTWTARVLTANTFDEVLR